MKSDVAIERRRAEGSGGRWEREGARGQMKGLTGDARSWRGFAGLCGVTVEDEIVLSDKVVESGQELLALGRPARRCRIGPAQRSMMSAPRLRSSIPDADGCLYADEENPWSLAKGVDDLGIGAEVCRNESRLPSFCSVVEEICCVW